MAENEELIAALRCCGSGEPCSKCPTGGDKNNSGVCDVFADIHKEAADALARLTADNAAKAAEIARLRQDNHDLRQHSVSHEVYQAVCGELDAVVAV